MIISVVTSEVRLGKEGIFSASAFNLAMSSLSLSCIEGSRLLHLEEMFADAGLNEAGGT